MIKDILINDILLKNTKGKLNSFIASRTITSRKAYLEQRLCILKQYKQQAINRMKEGRRKTEFLTEYEREIKSINYQLKQLA